MRGLINPYLGRAARLLNRLGLSGMNQLFKRILKIVTRDKITTVVEGLVIQGPAASWSVLSEIGAREFEPFEIELFKKSLAPGMVVVDVGANIGYYTLVAARIVGTYGRVFAFEPDPRNFDALAANVRANHFSNVTAFPKAASDSDAGHEMFFSSKSERSSFYLSPFLEKVEGTRHVETTTIDAVLNGLSADVVKMDIEGSEPAALRGMEKVLKPETVLFIEFNPNTLTAAGNDPNEFGWSLHERFASVEVIGKAQLIPFDQPPTELANLRCSGWRG